MKAHRRIAVLAIAVLAPATALCVLQYRSLLELESKTAATARERLNEVLAGSAQHFEARVQDLAARVLNPIAAPSPEAAAHLEGARRAQPEIREAFVISQCGCREPFAAYSSAEELITTIKRVDHERLHPIQQAYYHARPGRGGFRYYVASTNAPLLYVFRVLDEQHAVYAGLALDAAAILRDSVPRSGSQPMVFALVDSERRPLWSSGPPVTSSEAEVRFGPLAADWILQGAYAGASIAALAHQQFLRGAGLMALLVMGLLFGTGMTVRAANREARTAAMQSAFIANVSHEMKTPLAQIRMFSETLQMGRVREPERLSEYYEMLNRESRKLSGLIENVLEFGRMEAGRKEFRMAPGNVGDVVEQAMRGHAIQLRAGGFEWRVEIEPDLPHVTLDAEALGQAVGNLVENAIKYSAEQKVIAVEVFRRAADVAIAVSDRGIGIAASERDRIFDRFYRAGNPLLHNTKGSGLGLAIARHIVRAHGGEIEVESVPGRGSRFIIVLPAGGTPVTEPQGAEACQRS